MDPEDFYTRLKNISWRNGAGEALEFVRKNRDSLSAKTADGATVIQALMDIGSEKKARVDEVLIEVIALMDDEAINGTNKDGKTPLFSAAARKRTEVVEKLLERGADGSIGEQKSGWIPLHMACSNGDLATVNTLLAHNEEWIRCQDRKGRTSLSVACWRGHHEVVKVLLSKDREALDIASTDGASPLLKAVSYGHLEIVETLLEESGRLVNQADAEAVTPLDKACSTGFKEIAKLLVDKGADIESRDETGYTPLFTACIYGHVEIVDFLISRKATTTVKNNQGETCLIRASSSGFTEVVRRLLEVDAVRESIDESDEDGDTALMEACIFGRKEMAALLLRAGADRTKVDNDGNTPLMLASKWKYPAIVDLLLSPKDETSSKILNQRNDKSDGYSALHYACYYGHPRTVKLLLQYGADVNETDKKGRTALHNATRQGYKEVVEILSGEMENLNVVDNKGWTALHFASWHKFKEDDKPDYESSDDEPYMEAGEMVLVPGKHAEILQLLLKAGADLRAATEDKETALHLASESGHHSRVGVLLEGSSGQVEQALLMKDSHNRTALCLAMEQKNPFIVHQLIDRMETAEFGDTADKQELMLWLAKRQETHDLARLLLSKDKGEMGRPPNGAYAWSTLEWATYRGYPKLVWWLLFSTNPGPERDRKIRAAEGIAGSFVSRRNEKRHATRMKRGELQQDEQEEEGAENEQADSSRRDLDLEDKYFQILMILRNPPVTQTAGQRQRLTQSSDKPLYLPHSLELINHYKAEIVDCYSTEEHSGFLRRFASVKDVIYIQGPTQIMREAREKTHWLDSKFGPPDGATAGATWGEKAVNVRWIHLPANNMKWMNDLALTVSAKSRIDGGGLSWLDQTWDQVLGKNRSSRFMKPKCVYRKGKNADSDDEADDDMGQAAIYMPYITPAVHKKDPEKFSLEYRQLLEDYKDAVIHGSRTLDEFYYHSCEEKDFRLDILDRNEDQVLSKTIHGSVTGLNSWVLLNVDQVWIWAIDNKTIITSSTHRRDDVEDPLLTAVLENMSHASEMSTGHRGPTNTSQMSRLILDTCVGFFDREFRMKIDSMKGDPTTNTWKGSIQDVFTNALAQAALKEASLYGQFASNERSGRPEKSRSPGRRREILEAANLFREIKDIRDELKMLRTIAEYQQSVQDVSPRSSSSSGTSSAEWIVDGLREMDKSATRIENAVNTTLTLEQNEISIAQAQEAVSQGRTLMLFTVVTILFLPLSFFTSLFALDVASFQQTPTWAFLVLFCVSFAIFTPLATYAFFSDMVTTYYYKLLAYMKGGTEDPTSDSPDLLASGQAGRRGTFGTIKSNAQGTPKASTDVANRRVRGGLMLRSRARTYYDEETLAHKMSD